MDKGEQNLSSRGADLGSLIREVMESLEEAKFNLGDHEVVIKRPGVAGGGIMASAKDDNVLPMEELVCGHEVPKYLFAAGVVRYCPICGELGQRKKG